MLSYIDEDVRGVQNALQPAPALPQAPIPPQGGGSPIGLGGEALRAALTGLAGFLAARQGQLGTFAGSMGQMAQQQQMAAYRDQQLQLQQAAQDRLVARDQAVAEREAAEADYRTRHEQMQQQQQWEHQQQLEQKLLREDIQRRFKNQLALDSNAYANVTAPDGLKNFAIDVPGLGVVNLGDAMSQYGLDISGAVKPPAAPARTPLITVPGPDGKPTRAEDKVGAKVYERPRAPKEPKAAPKNTVRIVKDDDIESLTYGKQFRVVTDADGNVVKTEPLSLSGTKAPTKIGRFTVEVEP